ncbi:MAG: OmpH family outer membrane protein [Saprospiraceae bacterium]|nr:OmpH family outer membrane protein [Saprospiraceae bacterium]
MNRLITLLFLVFPILLSAQQKIGHIDMDKVVSAMPEYKVAQDSMQNVSKSLQKELMREQETIKVYYNEVMTQVQGGLLTPVQQQEAEAKLTSMQTGLEQKGREFDAKLSQLEADLMGEIQAKIGDALILYGRENGFSYILDLNQIMYYGGGIDVTSEVMAILNK